MNWTEIRENIYAIEDSCTVYCLKSGSKALLIETGTGRFANSLKELGVESVEMILHTHPHRDMSLGDDLFIEKGTDIAVPASAAHLYEKAEEGWRNRKTYYAFDYGEKFFMPLRDIPVSWKLSEGDRVQWNDFDLKVMETPGHTDHHISFILNHKEECLVFTGDMIHSHGRIWEFDSLQGTYEEFVQDPSIIKKIPALIESLGKIHDLNPALILPGHGMPFDRARPAIIELQSKLREVLEMLPTKGDMLSITTEIPDVKYLTCCQTTYLVKNNEGKNMLIDAGFIDSVLVDHPGILLDWLDENEVDSLDIILASHYHCDHIAATNAFQRKWGGLIISHEILGDIFREPARFFLPCLHLNPMEIDRTFKEGESMEWGEYTLTFFQFPGHTWWQQAVLLEKEGLKVLFTGDAVDFVDHIRSIDCWNYNPLSDNRGTAQCIDLLKRVNPDYIGAGHAGLVKWDSSNIAKMEEFLIKRNQLLRGMSARKDPDLGYDLNWVRADSFRNVINGGEEIEIKCIMRNHLPGTEGSLRPVLPEGWSSTPEKAGFTLHADRDRESEVYFTIRTPENCPEQRFAIGFDTVLDGDYYGELAFALIDIGGEKDPDRVPGLMEDVADFSYGSCKRN